jgi:hypothetical protein
MYEQTGLTQRRILVVESDFVDELRIAFEGSGSLEAQSMNLRDQTIAILRGSDVEAAIFDGQLDRDQSMQIADGLAALGIPFVFAESHDAAQLPEHLAAFTMTESGGELELIAHRLFGPPTYH